MSTFKELGLSVEILKVIEELGFESPTEIQAQAIPQLLYGDKDFIGLAQTGTGKTAAFGLPILMRLNPAVRKTQALILAPTRELGQQIAAQLKSFGKYMRGIETLAVYGGAAISNQMKALKKGPQVIIATPGRLIDLIHRKAVKLDQLGLIVLDEADEMLNMGFKEDIDKILSFTPDEKMTWLFSATMPDPIKRIVQKYMEDPIEIRINPESKINVNILHQYAIVRQADKMEALTRFLDAQADMRGLVFCRTKRDTQNLADDLLKKNYLVDALHGDLSQSQRDRVMKRFKAHELQVLIATDVAARGIDVNDLTHVFHFTLPDDSAYYTHRSGRTARAGKKGISLVFINSRENYKIDLLERKLRISFKRVLIPHTDDIADIRMENWCHEILKKKPKSKIDGALLNKVNNIFGNLSKEELTAKILVYNLEKLDLGSSTNLNKDTNESQNTRFSNSKGGHRSRNFHKKRKHPKTNRHHNKKRKFK